MKKCSDRVVDYLIKSEAITAEKKELYSYAVCSLFFEISPLALAISLGLCMNYVMESVVMVLPFMIIRKYSGGYHTESLWTCFMCSLLVLLFGIIASFYLETGWKLVVLTIGASASLIFFSPIDNEKKALNEKEKSKYKRKTGILTILILLLDSLLNFFEQDTYCVCISVGIMLAAFLQLPCIIKGKNDQK